MEHEYRFCAVDPNSATIIGALTGSHLHPDFSNVVDGNYGIPYVVVDSSATPGVAITMTTYQSESDITLYPIPITAPIEGFPADCTITGDDHLIVIDKNKCWIYETWQTSVATERGAQPTEPSGTLPAPSTALMGGPRRMRPAYPSFLGWCGTTRWLPA